MLVVVILMAAPAWAQSDLAPLASSNYDEIKRGVDALAVSGNPRAPAVLEALQSNRLLIGGDNALYIKNASGSIVAAATGEPAQPGATRPVRVNNMVRRSVDAAVGSLRLFARDPGERAAAAAAVFKARDAAAVPALDRALAKEGDDGVRRVMEQARAAAILATPDAAEAAKLSAVDTIAARGDLDARGMLASMANQPAPVMARAAAAVASIDSSLRLWSLAQGVFYGISLGSVLLLAAAGLAITFGVMGVINMAHGEMVMIGAYVTFMVQEGIRQHAPGLFGASLLIAVPLAFVASGAIGVLIERTLIRYLYGRPLETLLATFGLSLVLQQAVRTIFGPTNRDVGTPAWMSGSGTIGQLVVTYNRVAIVVFAVFVFAALMAVLRYTSLGLRMRAVTQNRRMAAAMGINTPWVDAMTFGLGSGVAGMAGVALSQIDNVSPNLGQGYIIDSFMVVVFGGVGNLWGTAVAALTLGVVNKFLEPIAGAVLGKIVVLILLILFIQRRPRGLFPLKGRAVES